MSCPVLTKNERNMRISNDNSGVKTVEDVINKMRKATSGGRRRRGGGRGTAACILILASAMLFGMSALSYKAAAGAYQAAGIKLDDIKRAQDNLDAVVNQQCGGVGKMAFTALQKDEGLLVADCEDYAKQVGVLVERARAIAYNAPEHLPVAFAAIKKGWTGASAAAAIICNFCFQQGGKRKRKRKRTRRRRRKSRRRRTKRRRRTRKRRRRRRR